MRILNRRLMSWGEERIVCRSCCSRWLSYGLLVLGAAGLASLPLWNPRSEDVPLLLVFLAAPSLGMLLLGAVLHWHAQSTVIDIPGGLVFTTELLMGLPLRTCEWRLDDFTSVRPKVHHSGREGNPAPYYTVTLCRSSPRLRTSASSVEPRAPSGGRTPPSGSRPEGAVEQDVPLFDVDDYEGARKAAARLASELGLGTE